MTTLEYMERQVAKHRFNFERENKRGVPYVMLDNIQRKINYYEEAVEALRKKATPVKVRCGGRAPRPVVRVNEETGEVVRFEMAKDARESLGIPEGSFGRILMTNSLRDGYRFYYEEDWDG